MSELLKPVITNGSWLILEKGLRLIGAFAVNAMVARYLGPEQYGIIAYLLAITAFFWGVTNLGADTIIVRELATRPTQSKDIFKTAIFIRLISGLFVYSSSVLIAYFSEDDHYKVLLWAIAGITIIFQFVEVVDLRYQSISKSKLTVLSKILAFTASSIVKILLIYLEYPLIAFVIAIAFEYLMYALTLIYSMKYFKIKEKSNFDYNIAKEIITESWPILISGIGTFIYWRSDQILVGHFLGKELLGIYASALSISQLPTNLPSIISISFAPYLAKLVNTNRNKFDQVIKKLFLYSFMASMALSIAIALTSYPLINTIYGVSYTQGSIALKIHVFSNIFIFLGTIQSIWLVVMKKTKIILFKVVIGALFCFISNIIFIPFLGISGAAISAVIATFFADIVATRILCPELFNLMMGRNE